MAAREAEEARTNPIPSGYLRSRVDGVETEMSASLPRDAAVTQSLSLREAALEERTLERQANALDRSRHLDDKERAFRLEMLEARREAEMRSNTVQDKEERVELLHRQRELDASKLAKELETRTADLTQQERELTLRSRGVLKKEADLIARAKDVEIREKTTAVREKDAEDRLALLDKAEVSERDRARALDETERQLKHTEERAKKELAERWRLLEENIHIFETKQKEEHLRLQRLVRTCEERECAVERHEQEVRARERQANELKVQCTQRETRLDDLEKSAIDRLKRELSEREANRKRGTLTGDATAAAGTSSSDMFTPTRTVPSLLHSLARPSPNYSAAHSLHHAQSQSPTELSPDSAVGDTDNPPEA